VSVEIDWNGVQLRLLPERALWQPDDGRVYIADLHFGKDAAFRSHGIAIPAAAGQADLDRLSALLRSTQARRLVVLGDLLHARAGMTAAVDAGFLSWRTRHPDLEIVLVRGNHDRSAGDPPPEWRITCVPEPAQEGGLALYHEPPPETVETRPSLAGHLHPCVTLQGSGRSRLTLPCFWVRPRLLVLPAFTDFAGRPQIFPAPQDRIFVVGEDIAEVRVG
jgi:DNA ligase-associated metallophosphoesterase